MLKLWDTGIIRCYHITSPDPTGRGAALCMQKAIKDAGLTTDDIDHYKCPRYSTQANDQTETRAIKALFGRTQYEIPITCQQVHVRTSWGGAGAAEAIVSIMTISHGHDSANH